MTQPLIKSHQIFGGAGGSGGAPPDYELVQLGSPSSSYTLVTISATKPAGGSPPANTTGVFVFVNGVQQTEGPAVGSPITTNFSFDYATQTVNFNSTAIPNTGDTLAVYAVSGVGAGGGSPTGGSFLPLAGGTFDPFAQVVLPGSPSPYGPSKLNRNQLILTSAVPASGFGIGEVHANRFYGDAGNSHGAGGVTYGFRDSTGGSPETFYRNVGMYYNPGSSELRFASGGFDRLIIPTGFPLKVNGGSPTTYTALVVDDNDIPNKDYVDNAFPEVSTAFQGGVATSVAGTVRTQVANMILTFEQGGNYRFEAYIPVRFTTAPSGSPNSFAVDLQAGSPTLGAATPGGNLTHFLYEDASARVLRDIKNDTSLIQEQLLDPQVFNTNQHLIKIEGTLDMGTSAKISSLRLFMSRDGSAGTVSIGGDAHMIATKID